MSDLNSPEGQAERAELVRAGLWMTTGDDRQFFPTRPEWYPFAEARSEVCFSVSKLCRYAGHTPVLYTVAAHSIFVYEIVAALRAPGPVTVADLRLLLASLIHDGPEAYTIDLPAPIKRMLGLAGYRDLCKSVEGLFARAFGIEPESRDPRVKEADMIALVLERNTFFPNTVHADDWLEAQAHARIVVPERVAKMRPHPWSPDQGAYAMLTIWKRLQEQIAEAERDVDIALDLPLAPRGR